MMEESPLERRLNSASERVTPERLTTVLVSGGVGSDVGPARAYCARGFHFLHERWCISMATNLA